MKEMTFDPIKIGENLKLALALSYIKGRGLSIKNFVDRLILEDPNKVGFKEKFEELIKVKGPYIQALDLPLYSERKFEEYARNLTLQHAQKGLSNELIETLKEFRIKRLYDFQQKAINKILFKLDDYLITAPTGRGKTEAWLIPLLHLIINIKKGKMASYKNKLNNRIKTKIVLMYPTKALAQDQFKRLINYLYILNSKLDIDNQITIGIYDGDTPSKRNYYAREILAGTYKLYQCPIFDSNNEMCQESCKNLIVKYDIPANETSRRPHITLSRERCEMKVNFNFIYLTREDIEANGVDILITNPDELNVQLININNMETRDIFILDPFYFVLDEAHVYSGIFGSYLSMIFKRLKACRNKELDAFNSRFYIIGASATIANKKEHFSKIIGRNENDFEVINAKSQTLNLGFNTVLSENDKEILSFLSKEQNLTDYKALKEIKKIITNFTISKLTMSTNEHIQDFLYDYFAQDQNSNILRALIVYFHQITNKQPLTKTEIINKLEEYLSKRFSYILNDVEMLNLFNNLYSLGTNSGIIENRSHLFVWPIDGFYGCINCGDIYQNLRAHCVECGEDFITKIMYCNQCSDIFYESWYCPECYNLFPSQINDGGLFNRFDSFFCPYEHEEKVECLRVIWKPQFICSNCKSTYHKRNIPNCPNCSIDFHFVPLEIMLDKSQKKYFYCNKCQGNFDYDEIKDREKICYNENCSSSIYDLLMKNSITQKNCECEESLDSSSVANKCPICGDKLEQKKILPWVCKNCGKKYFTKKPPKGNCKIEGCNSRTYYLDGYFEPSIFYEDSMNPSREYVKKKEDMIYKVKRVSLKNYCFIDQNFRIRKNININSRRFLFDGRCETEGSRQNKKIGTRFVDISYTPNFTSSRISQFLLRQFFLKNKLFNREEALHNAKLLSFADSVRDMNLLAENFFESEIVLFIDQLIFNALDTAPKKTLTLLELQEKTINALEEYVSFICKENTHFINQIKNKIKSSLKNAYPSIFNYFALEKKDLIEFLNEIIRQTVMNKYNVRKLISDAIIDFNIDIDDLSNVEKDLTLRLTKHHVYPPTLNSISYYKTSNSIKELNNIKEILKKSDSNDRAQIKLIKDKIKIKEDEIDHFKNDIESMLNELVVKKLLIHINKKNITVYYINPSKVKINLVSKDNPVYHNLQKDQFITKFEYRFLNNSAKLKLRPFNVDIKDRTDYTQPAFSQKAFLLKLYEPCLLNSEAYKGETKSTERREMENYFKMGMNLNYISSGPAMEVGIDIGNLNLMLLYGTPPNINSYLQRIGRAGRKIKKSLIVSVSKRNPIDYYYYQKPYDLMTQSVQPVPLNDKNQRVIKNSLVWSILDYLTSNYVIDWEEEKKS